MTDNNNETKDLSIENWPGYNYPLACRVLKDTDAKILYPVMKRSAKHLKGWVGWARYAPSWKMATVQKFVNDHVNSDFPRFHLVFTIGYEVVGFGSLAPMPNPRDIQVALWVGYGHERKNIGSWIVQVLEWYSFNVFGYDNIYYQHDAKNLKSGALPGKLGYKFSHSFSEDISAMNESGFWFSHKKSKPEGLPPGAIDTGTLENWHDYKLPWTSLI